MLYITLAILFVASIFFMLGKVRSDLVAMCALLLLMLFGILTPAEALAGFSNSVVIMMVGLFVVGAGIFRTGLAKMISSRILQLAGSSENKLFVLVMLTTASVGAFISNTGTVAVMMPIVVSLAANANINPSRYLMPLAFASSLGLFTLISTPPNLVIQDVLVRSGNDPLSFFSFAPIGLVCLAIGLMYLFFASKLLVGKDNAAASNKKQGKSLRELEKEYNLRQQTVLIHISKDSPLIDKSLSELKIATVYKVSLSKVVRGNGGGRFRMKNEELLAGPGTILRACDEIHCHGSREDIEHFVKENDLHVKSGHGRAFADFQDSGIAEVYILPNSSLVNRTIRDSKFREEFNVNVLGIKRQKEYQTYDFQDTKLHSGDAMLIQGRWKDIANLSDRQDDLVLVGQPLREAAKVTLDQKAPIAALIMLGMIVCMASNLLPSVTAVLIAAVLMVVTGCLRNVEEAYKSINWESIVLIGAMLPMSTAFEKTGAAVLISDGLVGQLGKLGPYALLAGIYFTTSILTLFISNTATAVLFAPIALHSAVSMAVSPLPFLFAVAVSASLCFASPFSTPPNALVMNVGRYDFMDYVRIGGPLQIIMGIILVLLLPLLFPF
ncbi:MAG: family permease [Bacteroidetes bacterium]|nr:family permease [Bacteroidota bacterium]